MESRYKVIPMLNNNQSLWIHPSKAKILGIQYRRIAYLRFGVGCAEVKITLSNEVDPQEIGLGNEIIQRLRIPLFSRYELAIRGHEIVIGPYIGILVHKKEETLDQNVEVYTNYLYDYETIGGAILAFSVEGIEMKSDKIRGYIFNPQTKKWEKGSYAYPAALFKRTGMKKSMRNYMHKMLGDAIFNEYILNKWETYEWLRSFEELKPHLLDSNIYNTIADLKDYFQLYNKIYVKPLAGSQGIGIIEIAKEEKRFIVTYVEDKETRKIYFEDENTICKYLGPSLKKGGMLLQRGVDFVHTKKRKNDFRLLILKSNKGIWEDHGMIVRHGVKGSIISNISGGGTAELGESFLRSGLNLSDNAAYQLRKKISSLGIKVGEAIEACGVNCGNLGIDMGIDEKGHIWIIEVNNKDPNHTIALDIQDRQMLYNIKRANMLYAKKLAGF